jgi:hypothetical protein
MPEYPAALNKQNEFLEIVLILRTHEWLEQ